MNKYLKLAIMLSLNGCSMISNFDGYSYNEKDSEVDSSYPEVDSNVSDAGIPDYQILSDSNYPDTMPDSSVGIFPIVSVIIDGQRQDIETSMCFPCQSDNDCLQGEHCDVYTYHTCMKPCTYLETFCNPANNFSCLSGNCIPNIGCVEWVASH